MPRIENMIVNGEFDIHLEVINPAVTGSVAGDGAFGKALDGTRWIKTGVADTDWEQFYISTDGVFNFHRDEGFVDTAVILDVNGLPVSGTILFKAD